MPARTPEYDYYEILGVSADASAEDIENAYKFQVFAFHPDRFPQGSRKEQASERTKLINHAYDVLGNSATRREYDAARTVQTGTKPENSPTSPPKQQYWPTQPPPPPSQQKKHAVYKELRAGEAKWKFPYSKVAWPIVAILCVLVPTLIGNAAHFTDGQGWKLDLLEFVCGCVRLFGTFFALWATAAVWFSKDASSQKR